ncbi:MAG: Rrf2 family transcriptional regulator [Chloroflexi bacterium]|nr:Rrf2 family transcriptional regulator [Chloroflexota bacterium]
MLTINRQTDYASRIILHLALQGDGSRVTTAEIAERRLIPKAFVRRVVTRLAAAGLIATTRGAEGGIVLARPAGEISLLEVVEAMEGPLALNACTVNPHTCPLVVACPVNKAWCHARDLLVGELRGMTFDQLAAKA